ncbi:hypothetical protein [Nonomuraea sp. NPDC048826]|uniref:hypothetical protein n=1 Tax=Nonomuraea sp. NPDC048826 TaxID=3364347 RepID=UPI003710965B
MRRYVTPEDLAELKAFRPIACALVAVWAIGTAARAHFFPQDLPLTADEQLALVALEVVALLGAVVTHTENVLTGAYKS